MRFGLGVPTATEGMMYPVPFAEPHEAVQLSVAAEELGFDSVWGNDHLTTQQYVRAEFEAPPRFYDPLVYLGYVAAKTTRIRLATGILVLAFRHPAQVAKQVATLDQLSGGRMVLGVGIGAYREEYEACWPGTEIHRGQHAQETLEALAALFTQRRASYDGRWVRFHDVESYPKPLQAPLPVLSGGNAPGSRRRAALLAQGWLPACLTTTELAAGVREIRRLAAEHGRDLTADFEVAPQFAVSLGRTEEEALDRFERSQVCAHMRSLGKSTLKGRSEDFTARNLIGTPDQVRARVRELAEAGVNTCSGLLFATNTVEETLAQMRTFAAEVIEPCRDIQTLLPDVEGVVA
jgi:probable F420-dependent oxidoreductase